MKAHPPKFWTRLFRRFCKDDFYEELQGDLEERFFQDVEKIGLKKAKAFYRKQVIAMLRPSVFGKPKKIQKLIMFSLIQMNFKLAMRNMVRHKAFSAINIFGLAAALCVSLFIINIIYTGYNLDRQHKDVSRVHRITNYITTAKTGRQMFVSIPFQAAELLKEDIPDFGAVTHFKTGFNGKFKINDEDISVKGIKADSAFFDVFNFQVVSGNPLSIFSDINSIIITDEIANKCFPGKDPIGQQTKEGYVVKAVLASPKMKSHLRFEIIGALEQFGQGLTTGDSHEYGWENYQNDYTYFRLRESSSPKALAPKLKRLTDKVNSLANFPDFEYDFSSQPVEGLVFGTPGFNEPGFIIGKDGAIVYVALITIMLLIASFNYTNLSIARAIQRTKEIGIRKVSGSSNGQIISQIICETLILSLFSLIIGLGIYKVFSDDFISLVPAIGNAFSPDLSIDIILVFVLFTILAGIAAGIFPALFFSKINPLSLFNPRIKSKKLSFLNLRKVLVTLQLTLSMFCVVLMILIQQQAALLKNRPKGFDTTGRIIVRTDSEKASLLKTAMIQVPGVDAITYVSDVPGDMMHGAVSFYDPVDNDSTLAVYSITADESFHKVVDAQLLDGRFFSNEIVAGTQSEILVNKEFLKLVAIDLSTAIGTVMTNDQQEYKIVGVIGGMISHPVFFGPTKPFMIVAGKPAINHTLLIKMDTRDLNSSLLRLEAAWKSIYPDNKFVPEQLETYLQQPVLEFNNIIKAQGFMAFAIIAISLLGQLGMAMYNAETRIKEISVRKVLGAKVKSIMQLLLKGTFIPLIIASLIACPTSFFLFEEILAINMSNPLHPNLMHFLVSVGLLTAVVVGVVLSQTWRVARLNPAESLRAE